MLKKIVKYLLIILMVIAGSFIAYVFLSNSFYVTGYKKAVTDVSNTIITSLEKEGSIQIIKDGEVLYKLVPENKQQVEAPVVVEEKTEVPKINQSFNFNQSNK